MRARSSREHEELTGVGSWNRPTYQKDVLDHALRTRRCARDTCLCVDGVDVLMLMRRVGVECTHASFHQHPPLTNQHHRQFRSQGRQGTWNRSRSAARLVLLHGISEDTFRPKMITGFTVAYFLLKKIKSVIICSDFSYRHVFEPQWRNIPSGVIYVRSQISFSFSFFGTVIDVTSFLHHTTANASTPPLTHFCSNLGCVLADRMCTTSFTWFLCSFCFPRTPNVKEVRNSDKRAGATMTLSKVAK